MEEDPEFANQPMGVHSILTIYRLMARELQPEILVSRLRNHSLWVSIAH